MPTDTISADTATAGDFTLQLAEREALRQLRITSFRLIGGVAAGLVIAGAGLRDNGNEVLWLILGMVTAFLMVSGYTPRMLRRSGVYVGGVRADMARAARLGLQNGTLSSPRLFELQRKTKIVNILRGLVIIGLILPVPIARILENRAYVEKYGDTQQVRPSSNPADYPPSYIGPIPAPRTLTELQQRIDDAENPPVRTRLSQQTGRTDLTPVVTDDTESVPQRPAQTRRAEPRIEYLVRHSDRRFYGVGP